MSDETEYLISNKKKALIDLRDKAKAGRTGREINRSLVWAVFRRESRVAGEPVGRIIDWILDSSDIRAMGAAKALHEAVLPEWPAVIQTNGGVQLHCPTNGARRPILNNNPARAWLIAILEALITEETE